MPTLYPTIGLTPQDFIALYDHIPIAVNFYDHTGLMVAANKTSADIFGIRPEEWIGKFNMVTDPQFIAMGSPERHQRVMQGETLVIPAHCIMAPNRDGQSDMLHEMWVEAIYAPLRNTQGEVTHLIAVLRDVTLEINQNKEIAKAQAEIASQQAMIESLSTPVVQVWEGILTMPLVGPIDSRRANQITEGLLTMIAERQAECVIIDITGVPLVDTQVAQHIIRTAHASKLLGCEVALVGIGVEMAQTLVQLGVDLHLLNTMANLQAGIAWAFRQCGMHVVNQV